MSEKKKTAGTYNLITGTGKTKQITKIFQALCKDTNEIWHAKMIDNESIKTYNLQKHLEFNEEIFANTRQKQNVIYVKEVFEKNSNTFIIQEFCDESLTERVIKEHPMSSVLIQVILNDVVNGLIELYGERYYTRSFRPEHVVCVDNVWKIESFVLDSKIFPIQSEFVWSGTFASPEDKYNNGKIEMEKVDEQMVWQVGILGLYMILGPRFEYEKILKDTDINWPQIKKMTSPQLYQMLQKSLKTNYDERIKIRNFLQLPVFKDLDIDLIMSMFQSGSKFFDPKKYPTSPLKKSTELSGEERKVWNGLKEDIERFRIFGEVDRYTQELTIKNQYDISLLKYLSFRLCFQNLKTIGEQSQKWVRFDSNVCNNSHLQSWIKDLKIKLNQVQKLKIRHLNILKKNSPTYSQIPIIKQFIISQQISDQATPLSKIITIYWRMAGFIYTNLVKNLEKSEENQELERTICYYSICAALLQSYKKQDFKEREKFEQGDAFNLRQYIKEIDIETLREVSQNLIKKGFQTQSN